MNAQLEDFGFLSLIGVIIVFLMFTTNCPPILYRWGTGISWNIKWESLSLLEYSTIKRHRTCHSALRVLFVVMLLTYALLAAFGASAFASPVAHPVAVARPVVTAPPDPALAKRATTCTFSGSNGASSASKSQASCSTIILSNVAVPSGTTLDLSNLNDNTAVSCVYSQVTFRIRL